MDVRTCVKLGSSSTWWVAASTDSKKPSQTGAHFRPYSFRKPQRPTQTGSTLYWRKLLLRLLLGMRATRLLALLVHELTSGTGMVVLTGAWNILQSGVSYFFFFFFFFFWQCSKRLWWYGLVVLVPSGSSIAWWAIIEKCLLHLNDGVNSIGRNVKQRERFIVISIWNWLKC